MNNYNSKYHRCLNKSIQEAYYNSHDWDEYELFLTGRKRYRDEVHEIERGSEKNYTEWNMIALTCEDHIKANVFEIKPRELFLAKIHSGVQLPKDIIRKYDLQKEHFDKFGV